MRVLLAVIYGYAGAALAGLLIAVAGSGLGLTAETVVSVATAAGAVLGVAGFSLPWWRALATARRPRHLR